MEVFIFCVNRYFVLLWQPKSKFGLSWMIQCLLTLPSSCKLSASHCFSQSWLLTLLNSWFLVPLLFDDNNLVAVMQLSSCLSG